MGSLFRSTVIKGNRLTDFTNTTATVGVPMPWGYGRYPVDGNVIWAPLPPKEKVKRTRQGKGGVKQETYTYTLSYSVAFGCRRIYGFWWIKRNGKVVYTRDPNAPAEDLAYAAKWLQKATLYDGLPNEMPDSTIESYEGSGQVSAFRNVPKIVLEDDDVTEGGGAVPSYEACVIASPPEAYLTSKPFPASETDGQSLVVGVETGKLRGLLINAAIPDDQQFVGFDFGTATLRAPLIQVTVDPEDQGIAFTFGTAILRAPLKLLPAQPPERSSMSVSFNTGILRFALVTHSSQPPERQQTSLTFNEANLYVP